MSQNEEITNSNDNFSCYRLASGLRKNRTRRRRKLMQKTSQTNNNRDNNKNNNIENITDTSIKNQKTGFHIDKNTLNLEGTYKNDLDILKIDEFLRNHLLNIDNSSEYEKLLKSKEEYKRKLKNCSYIDKNHYLQILRDINKKLGDMKKKNGYQEYINNVKDILKEYEKIGRHVNKVYFGMDDSNNDFIGDVSTLAGDFFGLNDKNLKNRNILINKYLSLISKYITINLEKRTNYVNKCMNCNRILDDINSDNNGLVVCPNCHVQNIMLNRITKYDDSDMYSKTKTKKNETEKKFIEAMDQFECKNITIQLPDYKEALDNYFISHEYPPGDRVKWFNKNKKEILDNIRNDNSYDKEQLFKLYNKIKELDVVCMIKALKSIGMQSYYKYYMLICNNYWGWNIIYLNDYRELCLRDLGQFISIYENIKGNRSSFLNIQYILWRILQKNNCYINPGKFKLPCGSDVLNKHDDIWNKACTILKWKYHGSIQYFLNK